MGAGPPRLPSDRTSPTATRSSLRWRLGPASDRVVRRWPYRRAADRVEGGWPCMTPSQANRPEPVSGIWGEISPTAVGPSQCFGIATAARWSTPSHTLRGGGRPGSARELATTPARKRWRSINSIARRHGLGVSVQPNRPLAPFATSERACCGAPSTTRSETTSPASRSSCSSSLHWRCHRSNALRHPTPGALRRDFAGSSRFLWPTRPVFRSKRGSCAKTQSSPSGRKTTKKMMNPVAQRDRRTIPTIPPSPLPAARRRGTSWCLAASRPGTLCAAEPSSPTSA